MKANSVATQNIYIIIDGYSTGSELVQILSARGFSCIHIITPSMVDVARANHFPCPTKSKYYIAELFYTGDLQNLLKEIRQWKVLGVVCGYEGDGVILSEELSAALGLPHNDLTKIAARRDKFFMAQYLQEANLPHLSQILVSTCKDIDKKREDIGDYPVILKPRDSAVSYGVKICRNKEELQSACQQLLKQKNFFNQLNQTILLQECLHGKEYAINTISYAGQAYITDVWSYHVIYTNNGCHVTLSAHLEYEINDNLKSYVIACLQALGMYYGAAHTEIMVTERGPIMIESAARLMGSMPNDILKEVLYTTQLDALVELLIMPQKINALTFGMRAELAIVNIRAQVQNGIIIEIKNFDLIERLNSYRKHQIFVKIGENLVLFGSCPARLARIYLVNHNKQSLQDDITAIRKLEDTLFVIKET